MSESTKTCLNCFHRRGGECTRTGFYCTTELQFGGRCAGPKNGTPLMLLWEPRKPNLWQRLKGWFK